MVRIGSISLELPADDAFRSPISSGLPAAARLALIATMSTKSREVIYGGRIIGAKIRADGARDAAKKAGRFKWKPMVGRRNRPPRSGNASTAAMAGYR
jgi:hypothetical protein